MRARPKDQCVFGLNYVRIIVNQEITVMRVAAIGLLRIKWNLVGRSYSQTCTDIKTMNQQQKLS